MMATLLGAVVSDGLENGQVVSGVGGQYNFVAQAFALEDARSIIMLRCDAAAEADDLEHPLELRPHHHPAPSARHRGDGIRHRRFARKNGPRRDRRHARGRRLALPGRIAAAGEGRRQDREGFELPAACRDNTPERIARALAPAREQGLLPAFPFGTDFTADRAAAAAGAAAVACGLAAAPRRPAGARIFVLRAVEPRCGNVSPGWRSTVRRVPMARVEAALLRGACSARGSSLISVPPCSPTTKDYSP